VRDLLAGTEPAPGAWVVSFIPTGAVRPTVPFFQVMGPHQWWLGASYCRYDASVRTTIDLPDDIHELVRYLAASRGESLGATIAAVLENVIDTEDRVTHAVRGVQIDPKSGLLSVSGGPLRRAAEVRSLAYDE